MVIIGASGWARLVSLVTFLLLFIAGVSQAQTPSFEQFTSKRKAPAAKAASVSVTGSNTPIYPGGNATYTVQISRPNPDAPIIVNFAMTGTAIAGTDYFISPSGSVAIPPGAQQATITLVALASRDASKHVATLRIQGGSGYKVSARNKSTITIMPSIGPTPTPTPTATPIPTPSATPRPTPAAEMWIAIRTDGLPGTGTQTDPFDGSTPANFDTLLQSFPVWAEIHLGAGIFQTSVSHTWKIKPGWILQGAGMDLTTIQLTGDASQSHGLPCLASDPSISTDNVIISSLTVDCNWPQLSITAPDGAGGEKDCAFTAVAIWGSNNLLDQIRSINSYGSSANGREQFAILLCGPRAGDGTNNTIQSCRAELPHGTYGNPFALAGWGNSLPHHLITNSKVVSSYAVGNNSGLETGFTSGGVNLAYVKDCLIDSNTFVDCYAAAYQDTGSCDGLKVTNNTVIRGWEGVGISGDELPKQNIEISGNNFLIQNRDPIGGSYGVVVAYAVTTNIVIQNNTVTFDSSGLGFHQVWGIAAEFLNNATISDNTIGAAPVSYQMINTATGLGVKMFNNRYPDGSVIPGLLDNTPPPP